jgi:uncharacterized membrane protein
MSDESSKKSPTDQPPNSPENIPAEVSQQQRDAAAASAGPVPASAHFPYPIGTSGGTAVVQQAVQIWQSPYPPPDAIERYEKVCPGTLDRILGMAERLQEAQLTQAATNARAARDDTRRAHWLGFAVAIAALFAAIVSLLLGDNAWVASLCLSVPVMAVAKALIDSAKA